ASGLHTASATSVGNASFGWITNPGASKVLNIDDVAINDISGTTQTSWPGEGNIVLLKPTSDNQIGSWTGGAGGTTNLWDAVNNTPPVGITGGSNTATI